MQFFKKTKETTISLSRRTVLLDYYIRYQKIYYDLVLNGQDKTRGLFMCTKIKQQIYRAPPARTRPRKKVHT